MHDCAEEVFLLCIVVASVHGVVEGVGDVGGRPLNEKADGVVAHLVGSEVLLTGLVDITPRCHQWLQFGCYPLELGGDGVSQGVQASGRRRGHHVVAVDGVGAVADAVVVDVLPSQSLVALGADRNELLGLGVQKEARREVLHGVDGHVLERGDHGEAGLRVERELVSTDGNRLHVA